MIKYEVFNIVVISDVMITIQMCIYVYKQSIKLI